MKKNVEINKEDINKILDNVNFWINNSDTKASIILGFLGIFISIIFTNNKILAKIINIFNNLFIDISFDDIIYLILFALSIFSLFYGLYKLIKVLVPDLKLKDYSQKSPVYFGGIASYKSFNEYKEDFKKLDDESFKEELLSQIYINSIICNNKFKNFKVGLIFSLLGIIVFFGLFLIGILIY